MSVSLCTKVFFTRQLFLLIIKLLHEIYTRLFFFHSFYTQRFYYHQPENKFDFFFVSSSLCKRLRHEEISLIDFFPFPLYYTIEVRQLKVIVLMMILLWKKEIAFLARFILWLWLWTSKQNILLDMCTSQFRILKKLLASRWREFYILWGVRGRFGG